jgi:hypothetical protein
MDKSAVAEDNKTGGITGHVQNDLLSTWMLVQKVGGIVD